MGRPASISVRFTPTPPPGPTGLSALHGLAGWGGDEVPVAAAGGEEDSGAVVGEVGEPSGRPFDLLDDRVQSFGGAVRCSGGVPGKDGFTPLFQRAAQAFDLGHGRGSGLGDEGVKPQCGEAFMTPHRVQLPHVFLDDPRLEHFPVRVTKREEPRGHTPDKTGPVPPFQDGSPTPPPPGPPTTPERSADQSGAPTSRTDHQTQTPPNHPSHPARM